MCVFVCVCWRPTGPLRTSCTQTRWSWHQVGITWMPPRSRVLLPSSAKVTNWHTRSCCVWASCTTPGRTDLRRSTATGPGRWSAAGEQLSQHTVAGALPVQTRCLTKGACHCCAETRKHGTPSSARLAHLVDVSAHTHVLQWLLPQAHTQLLLPHCAGTNPMAKHTRTLAALPDSVPP